MEGYFVTYQKKLNFSNGQEQRTSRRPPTDTVDDMKGCRLFCPENIIFYDSQMIWKSGHKPSKNHTKNVFIYIFIYIKSITIFFFFYFSNEMSCKKLQILIIRNQLVHLPSKATSDMWISKLCKIHTLPTRNYSHKQNILYYIVLYLAKKNSHASLLSKLFKFYNFLFIYIFSVL